MSVKIAKDGTPLSFPLTSPPPDHSSYVDPEWIAKELIFSDRKISVTYPFPDKFKIVSSVGHSIMAFPDGSGKSAVDVGKQIDQEMMQHLEAFPADPQNGIKALKLFPGCVEVDLSDHQGHLAWVKVTRKKGKIADFGSWKIEISFSPFKVGQDRMHLLAEKFEDAFMLIDFVKLISQARITRLDCAIDIYGAHPFDLILQRPNGGKTCLWTEQNDQPATIYLFDQKDCPIKAPKHGSFKPHGPQLALVYDRLAEAKWYCRDLPAGNAPVTRYEVQKIWKSNWPSIAKLPVLSNMLLKGAAGYGGNNDIIRSPAWRQICLERFPAKRKWAKLPGNASKMITLNQLYDKFPMDLVHPDDWSEWGKGLDLTGLSYLIEKKS